MGGIRRAQFRHGGRAWEIALEQRDVVLHELRGGTPWSYASGSYGRDEQRRRVLRFPGLEAHDRALAEAAAAALGALLRRPLLVSLEAAPSSAQGPAEGSAEAPAEASAPAVEQVGQGCAGAAEGAAAAAARQPGEDDGDDDEGCDCVTCGKPMGARAAQYGKKWCSAACKPDYRREPEAAPAKRCARPGCERDARRVYCSLECRMTVAAEREANSPQEPRQRPSTGKALGPSFAWRRGRSAAPEAVEQPQASGRCCRYEGCGKPLPVDARKDMKFCDGTCRLRAFVAGKQGGAPAQPPSPVVEAPALKAEALPRLSAAERRRRLQLLRADED